MTRGVLLPHQYKTVERIVARCQNQKGLLLYHHMGTGKTFLALTILLNFPEHEKIIYCPEQIKSVWQNQIEKHNFPFKTRSTEKNNVKSYVHIESHKEMIKTINLKNKIVIIDEAHHIHLMHRNDETKANILQFVKNVQKAHKIILLTGTPISKSINDFSYLINLVAGKDILPYGLVQFQRELMFVPWKKKVFWGYLIPILGTTLGKAFSAVAAYKLTNSFATAVFFMSTIFIINEAYTPDLIFELDVDKFLNRVGPFIDIYHPKEECKEYPTFYKTTQEVPYNSYQAEDWLKFVYNIHSVDLHRLFEDGNVDQKSIFLSPKEAYLDAGLTIGNQIYQENGKKIFPDKFENVLDNIQFLEDAFDEMTPLDENRHVIYSSFYKKGILLFSEYLKSKKIKHDILLPTMRVKEINDILTNFRKKKESILLLHPNFYEGISILGANALHILEPIRNMSRYEQIIGRVIRYDSHLHLPPQKRKVHIFEYVSTLKNKKNEILAEASIWRSFFPNIIMSKMEQFFSKETTPDQLIDKSNLTIEQIQNKIVKTFQKNKSKIKLCSHEDDNVKCKITTPTEQGNC